MTDSPKSKSKSKGEDGSSFSPGDVALLVILIGAGLLLTAVVIRSVVDKRTLLAREDSVSSLNGNGADVPADETVAP